MLKIRLMKPGKSIKKRHHFKIVVMDAKCARDSRFVEQIGYYDPSQELLKVDLEKYQKWVNQGAQPTETTAALAKRYKKSLDNKSVVVE